MINVAELVRYRLESADNRPLEGIKTPTSREYVG